MYEFLSENNRLAIYYINFYGMAAKCMVITFLAEALTKTLITLKWLDIHLQEREQKMAVIKGYVSRRLHVNELL